ncbi:MAG: phosphatidylglycerophosphatase A [Elusimicrobia bacterium]|jgi:phosphatidylglycerophosphatase A|nr:phosphatidylglycerophosphatase A [Elusimicrobiota bacterium]
MKKIIRIIATGFYIGDKLPAPGTMASIAAAAVYYLLFKMVGPFNPSVYWTVMLFIIVIGVFVSGRAADEIYHEADPPEVVIDEIAGVVIALAFFPEPKIGLVVLGLAIFRVLDISKVYPINKLEMIAGGTGIMLDDIFAGVLTNVILRIILFSATIIAP